LVNPGQVAAITYSDTCAVEVGSDRVWTIQEAAPCANGNRGIDFTGRMNHSGSAVWFTQIDPVIVGSVAVGVGLIIGCIASWCGGDFAPELRPAAAGVADRSPFWARQSDTQTR
jgi:hypothetical protein